MPGRGLDRVVLGIQQVDTEGPDAAPRAFLGYLGSVAERQKFHRRTGNLPSVGPPLPCVFLSLRAERSNPIPLCAATGIAASQHF